jgi:hypothetical protein
MKSTTEQIVGILTEISELDAQISDGVAKLREDLSAEMARLRHQRHVSGIYGADVQPPPSQGTPGALGGAQGASGAPPGEQSSLGVQGDQAALADLRRIPKAHKTQLRSLKEASFGSSFDIKQ